MKTVALCLLVVLAAGCGGSWSNKDLEFVNALPLREDLQAQLPQAAAGGLTGVGTRRDGLGLGEASQSYKDTQGASKSFNSILDKLLTVIEQVRSFPPTSRTIDTRTWGPWTDSNPSFEVQVVIKREDASHFVYAVQQRPKGGDFVSLVTGRFIPTANLHKGQGALSINIKEGRAASLPIGKDFAALDQIVIQYQTETFPTAVQMLFTATPGQASMVSSVGYSYQATEAKAGQIFFAVTGTNPDILQYVTTSRWQAGGAGGSATSVTEGNYKGATQVECWDNAFLTTYAKQSWPGGIELGNPASCVKVEGFSP